MAVTLDACRATDMRQEPVLEPRGEIIVAYPDDPPSLNPFTYDGDSIATRDLLRPVFPTLLSVGPDQKYKPALAKRVPSGRDLSNTPFTVNFELDPRAVWADGIPVTAEDVRFTWQTITNASLPIPGREPYEHLADVITTGEHGVKLVFDGPYAAWPDLFSSGYFVMPKHALEGKDFLQAWTPQLPGSGPFVIESFEPELQIVYRANPRWWGRGPGLERITVQFVPSLDTGLRLLEQNRVHVLAATTQLNLTRRLERIEGVNVTSSYGYSWWELAFNHSRPGPDSPGFRRAVATAFDRAGILEALVRDQGRSLENLTPGRKVEPTFARFTHSPDAARDSLVRAGFVGGRDGKFDKSGVPTIGLSTPEENEVALVVERAIFEGLRNVGIDVELRNPRSGLLYGSWRREGSFDLALWERRGSPNQPLGPHFRGGTSPPAGLNYYRLRSPDVDSAIQLAETGDSFRSETLNDVTRLLSETLPAIPIFEAQAFLGFREGVSGPDPCACIDGPLWNLYEWTKE